MSLFVLTGQYRGLSKYLNSKAFYFLLLRNTFLIFFVIIFGKIFGLTLLKFKNWIILWFILNFATSFVRIILRDLQIFLGFLQAKNIKKIVIYGAGEAGALLSSSLRYTSNWQIIAFVDDNPDLWGRGLQGKLIYSPKILKDLKKDFDLVCLLFHLFLVIERKNINQLQKQEINIIQVPSISEIISGKSSINELKTVNIEDLLRRKF